MMNDQKMFDLINKNNPIKLLESIVNSNNKKALFLTINNERILDYLINNIFCSDKYSDIEKYNCSFILNRYVRSNLDVKDLANVYVSFGKNFVIDYLPKLKTKELLKNNLLKELIIQDKDTTLNEILYEDNINNDILIYLRILGVDYKEPIVEETEDLSYKYIEDFNKNYQNNDLDDEEIALLNELKYVMSDGKSDNVLINTLLISYSNYLKNNREIAILEIKKLIEIKKNNKDSFNYMLLKENAYFNPDIGIVLENNLIELLNHETAHALHYYLSNEKEPNNFKNILNNLKNNNHLIDSISSYTKQFEKLDKTIINEAQDYYDKQITNYLTKEKINEINNYLDKIKKEKYEYFKKMGNLSEKNIKKVLDNLYTFDNYLYDQAHVNKTKLIDYILRTKYTSYRIFNDLFDSITEGQYHDFGITNRKNEKLYGIYGHGTKYYDSERNRYMEIVANYITMTKSQNYEKTKEIMYSIFGKEFVNALDDLYLNSMLYSENYSYENNSHRM